jgi:hypothetical protein
MTAAPRFAVGDIVISSRSWTSLEVWRIDEAAQMLSDANGRACSFDEAHPTGRRFENPFAVSDEAPAVSIEVSPVMRTPEGFTTCHGQEILAHGFAVYLRAPLAFHVADFLLPDWMEGTGHNLAAAKRAAFTFARQLGEHLGCDLDEQTKRYSTMGFPLAEPLAQGDLLDAAACLWEVALDFLNQGDPEKLAPWHRAFIQQKEDEGICDVRQLVAGFAEACERDWLAARKADAFDAPFDWEFCPRWLAAALARYYNMEEPA